MPKLDETHIEDRLRQRLEQLRNGEEVARRELESLLTAEQVEAWDAAWEQQKRLRKHKRARTKEEEQALGWKSKREITIEIVEAALNQAQNGLVEEYERLLKNAEIRQARIYLDTYSKARSKGAYPYSADRQANNALTKAGLRRVDGQEVWAKMTPRDKEVLEMEQALKQHFIDTMTEEERKEYLEQQEILDEMEAYRKKKPKALRRL